MTDPNRILIGQWATVMIREKVYQTSEAIETEANEQYEVTQRRVMFEDVLLVTYHRYRGKLYLTLFGVASFGFLLLVLSLTAGGGEQGLIMAIPVGLVGLPLLTAFLIRAIFGVDVVTVFGRRSKAAIRFRFRKRRARQLYGQICAAVRTAQRHLELTIASETPPPSAPDEQPPGPPGPPEPGSFGSG
ncbi:MAG TPA: hypothetical protein VFT12_08100 [Thermoanaerobaculia bacterium]|nr:hypothetical protein [Thermoanaerobaculia bacterium]